MTVRNNALEGIPMKHFYLLVPLALAVGCHLCSFNNDKPNRAPVVTNAEGTTTRTPNSVQADTKARSVAISLSPANMNIAFTGSTALMSQTGHFERYEGTLEVPTGDPKDLKIRVAIDMDSTTTKIGLLTKHLKAEDFFDVARFPKAEFVLDSVEPTGDAGQFQVFGKLSLRGVARPVAFPARIRITSERVSFNATINVLQTEFGMTEAARKTKDEVPVTVSIHAMRKSS